MARGTMTPRLPPVAVVVADSDPGSRDEIVGLLERLGCLVQAVDTGEAALEAIRRERPGVVVLDVELAGLSGYQVCRELRDEFGETLPIMFVSAGRADPADEIAGLLLGADDYLVKPLKTDQFLAHMRRLMARSDRSGPGAAGLTAREHEVLGLLVDGLRPSEIAEQLCIVPKTASSHIEHILAKLGAHTQAQAVSFAVRDGLVNGRG
jgi:DNA-binding NarL/FixJ family response regulator